MELFVKIVNGFQPITIYANKIHDRCLTVFLIHLWVHYYQLAAYSHVTRHLEQKRCSHFHDRKEETHLTGMTNKLASTRSFLKKITSSCVVNADCCFELGSLRRKICALSWRQLSDIPTEPLLNLYSPTFGIQQDCLIVESESRHYRHHHHFWFSQPHFSTILPQLRASNTLSRPTKKKIYIRLRVHPDSRFFYITTHYIGALLPKLVPQECHFRPTLFS